MVRPRSLTPVLRSHGAREPDDALPRPPTSLLPPGVLRCDHAQLSAPAPHAGLAARRPDPPLRGRDPEQPGGAQAAPGVARIIRGADLVRVSALPVQHVHGEPRRFHGEPGARDGGDREHAAVVDRARRSGLPALVHDRHVPRRARGLATGRVRRHRRDADPDGSPLLPRLLPQPARGLLPRLPSRLVPDPARLLDRRRAYMVVGVRRRRVPPRPAAHPHRCRAQRRWLDARHAKRDHRRSRRTTLRSPMPRASRIARSGTATRRGMRSSRR